MQEITLNNKNYLLVEVLEEARDFMITPHNNSITWLGSNRTISGGNGGIIKLEYDVRNLTIIDKISDILKDEDICKELVDKSVYFENTFHNYTDFGKSLVEKLKNLQFIYQFNKAKDSFLSYLQSIDLDMTKEYLLIQKL